MKKVCYLTNCITNLGGIERVISTHSFAFEKDGTIDLTILSLNSKPGQNSSFQFSPSTKIIHCGFPFESNCDDFLIDFFQKNKFDTLVTFHSPIAHTVARLRKKLPPMRLVMTEHCSPRDYTWKRQLLNLYVYRKADKFVVLINDSARYYRRFGFRGVLVVPNPVSFTSDKCSDYNKVILAVGRIEEVKRYDLLVEAFGRIADKYPDWTLRIVGHGTQQETVRKLAEPYKNIEFQNFSDDVKSLMLDASFLAISSTFEGFPMVAVEALECGLPIVSTKLPAIASMTQGTNSALFAEQNDPADLADKIEQLILDPGLVREMGRQAKQCALQYRPEVIVERWKEIF